MDLVDEQHVAVVEIGEDGGEVAGSLERGPAGDAQRDPELGGDDAGQRRLPGSRRSREEQMVDGLPALARRGEQDLEVLLQPLLAHELLQAARAQRGLLGPLDRVGARAEQLLPRHA